MESIDVYRKAGLPRKDIARVQESDDSELSGLEVARIRDWSGNQG